MKKPALPANEAERLENLNQLKILYSPAEERFDRITRIVRRIFDAPVALVSLVSEDKQWIKSNQGLSDTETPREFSFCGHAILRQEPLIIQNAAKDPDFADNPLVTSAPGIRFYAGCPIRYEGTPLGTLCVIDMVPRQFKSSDVDALKSLAAWVENELKVNRMSVAQMDLLSKLNDSERRSMIDPVTRVWNQTAMDDVLETEFARAKRQKTPMALLQVDVAGFEGLVEQHGEVAADEILREVTQRIRNCVRPHDVVGRVGNHEFLIFLGGCNAVDTKSIARRISARIADEAINVEDKAIPVRLNIGAASSRTVTDLMLRKLKELATAAMYEARKNIEACVVLKAGI
ncbi:MAG TPA: sensor domain-containing diguanylate cyclase [Gammaproteobacteria bacterium]|nr:sensor domain-containing diguanylate cyclase [Gammaproteobacteria bacterium]